MEQFSFIIEPMQYPFMQDAFLVGLIVSALCAIFSCLLVLKGWSLMGDALSHAILPGIVIAYWIKIPLAIGAFVSGLICAVATVKIKSHVRVKEDTILGVVFTGMFALGIVLFTKTSSELHLDHILFGNILGIQSSDIIETCILGSICFLLFGIFHRNILLSIFDPIFAKTIGIKNQQYNYLLLSLVSLTIITSIKAVGVILVISMLITPGCIAMQVTKHMYKMFLVALIGSCSSCFLGIYLSFFWNSSSGATIVLVQSALLAIIIFLENLSHRQHKPLILK